MTPKISDRPLPTRNSSAPYEIPLKVWTTQNCVFMSPSCPSVYSKVAASLHELWREGTPQRLRARALPALLAFGGCLNLRWNDRQQQVGRLSVGEMQRGGAAEDRRRRSSSLLCR